MRIYLTFGVALKVDLVFRLIHEGSPALGDHNTGILVLCTILVYKNIPVLYSSIVPVL
jgi:hypothetical protein